MLIQKRLLTVCFLLLVLVLLAVANAQLISAAGGDGGYLGVDWGFLPLTLSAFFVGALSLIALAVKGRAGFRFVVLVLALVVLAGSKMLWFFWADGADHEQRLVALKSLVGKAAIVNYAAYPGEGSDFTPPEKLRFQLVGDLFRGAFSDQEAVHGVRPRSSFVASLLQDASLDPYLLLPKPKKTEPEMDEVQEKPPEVEVVTAYTDVEGAPPLPARRASGSRPAFDRFTDFYQRYQELFVLLDRATREGSADDRADQLVNFILSDREQFFMESDAAPSDYESGNFEHPAFVRFINESETRAWVERALSQYGVELRNIVYRNPGQLQDRVRSFLHQQALADARSMQAEQGLAIMPGATPASMDAVWGELMSGDSSLSEYRSYLASNPSARPVSQSFREERTFTRIVEPDPVDVASSSEGGAGDVERIDSQVMLAAVVPYFYFVVNLVLFVLLVIALLMVLVRSVVSGRILAVVAVVGGLAMAFTPLANQGYHLTYWTDKAVTSAGLGSLLSTGNKVSHQSLVDHHWQQARSAVADNRLATPVSRSALLHLMMVRYYEPGKEIDSLLDQMIERYEGMGAGDPESRLYERQQYIKGLK